MMGLRDFTVYDYISRNAMLYAGKDAVVFGDVRLNHGQYKEKCDQCAAGLVKAGIGTGDRIAVIAQNSHQFMILYGAAAKIGAIVLPVNWRFQGEEIAYVLKDCTPKVVFADFEHQETVAAQARQMPFIEGFYGIASEKNLAPYRPFETLYREEGADASYDIAADAGYVIIHTAAVEGTPRGALLSQANIVAINVQMMAVNRLDEDAAHLCVLPLFHIAAIAMSMAVMHRGGKNVILDRFDPAAALRLIEKERITTFGSFAPMLKMLIEKTREVPWDFSSLLSIGGLEDPESIMAFLKMAPNAAFYSAYGQTEAMSVTGCNAAERPGSAGRPSMMTRVALFDDYDQEVPSGEAGEICVRSPAVFLGYWGLEADTAHTFRNGWHHTGDIGRFDGDGYLWYVKRKAQKELIKPGGENVYPAEVEKAILTHGDIAEVSVIGVPDDAWGEAIKAVCVVKPGHAADAQALIDHVASKIARYKKPKHIVFVEALPRTKDGDVDRVQIKKEHGGKY